MDDKQYRHALWVARAMGRSDLTPLRTEDVKALDGICEIRHVPEGTVLMNADTEVKEVLIVRSGEVRLAVRRSSGGRQAIGLVREGGVVADIPMFCDEPMPFDVLAGEGCAVLVAPRDELFAVLHRSATLCLRWTTSVAKRMNQSQRRMTILLTKDLTSQIATLLLEERIRQPGSPDIVRLPHRTIADLLGARRQSVSRILSKFREQGLIDTRYGETELLDVDGLAREGKVELDQLDCATKPAGVRMPALHKTA